MVFFVSRIFFKESLKIKFEARLSGFPFLLQKKLTFELFRSELLSRHSFLTIFISQNFPPVEGSLSTPPSYETWYFLPHLVQSRKQNIYIYNENVKYFYENFSHRSTFAQFGTAFPRAFDWLPPFDFEFERSYWSEL